MVALPYDGSAGERQGPVSASEAPSAAFTLTTVGKSQFLPVTVLDCDICALFPRDRSQHTNTLKQSLEQKWSGKCLGIDTLGGFF